MWTGSNWIQNASCELCTITNRLLSPLPHKERCKWWRYQALEAFQGSRIGTSTDLGCKCPGMQNYIRFANYRTNVSLQGALLALQAWLGSRQHRQVTYSFIHAMYRLQVATAMSCDMPLALTNWQVTVRDVVSSLPEETHPKMSGRFG